MGNSVCGPRLGLLLRVPATGSSDGRVWETCRASRLQPIPRTWDGSSVENSATVKCQGIYLSVPEILISLLKKNTTHLANRQSGKNVPLNKYPEWPLRMLEMMNCAKKMPVADCQQAIFGGSKARGPASRAHTALLFVCVYL